MAEGTIWTVATPYEEHRAFETAAEAEAYAERLCTAAYGDRDETRHQLPFRATLDGNVWRVVGSRPYNWPITSFPLTGPLTIVFRKGDRPDARCAFHRCACWVGWGHPPPFGARTRRFRKGMIVPGAA